MEQPVYKVTIGMPVYNVEDYIKPSLMCALEQDLDDIEILIIDDCGSDSSMDIIRQMQQAHPHGGRIRIVKHERNLGVAEGRNTILREARGKYIFFQDSDDFIEKNTLSILYHAAEEHGAEVTYGSTYIRENGSDRPYMVFNNTVLKGADALANYIYNDIHENIPNSIWNILILTDFVRQHHISFPNFRRGEDLMFNEQLQPLVTCAVLLPDVTYYYQKRPNSLMSFQSRDVIDVKEVESSLRFSEMQKQYCQALSSKPYYDRKCAKTMKMIFYSVCGILKHRHQLTGNVSDKAIRDSMRHPASLLTIMRFRQQKGTNLMFWLMGVLPAKCSVAAMKAIGRKKGYIK